MASEDPKSNRAGSRQPPGALSEKCVVTLMLERGKVASVEVRGRRLASLRAALIGSPARDAPTLVSKLFPICGWSQRIAVSRAVEAAETRDADEATEARRAQVLTAEAAFTHVWRLAIDWPQLTGGPVRVEAARAARAALDAIASGKGAAAAETLAGLVETLSPHLALETRLSGIADQPLDPPLPVYPAEWFHDRLAANARFCDMPDVDDTPADPLPRNRGAQLQDRLDAICNAMQETARRFRRSPEPQHWSATRYSPSPGIGCGIAQTARGPLACRVRLEDGRIADFRTVAPTEWIMHPDGALARALAALHGDDIARDAHTLIALFDPCAEVALNIEEAADA